MMRKIPEKIYISPDGYRNKYSTSKIYDTNIEYVHNDIAKEANRRSKIARLIGEYTGTLEAIRMHKISPELDVKLKETIDKLEEMNVEDFL